MRATPTQGFTLIELLTVIAIVAVLMAITLPFARQTMEGNAMVACMSNMQQLHQALGLYKMDEAGYPYFDPITDGPPPAWSFATDGEHRHYGLLRLADAGYIRNIQLLHCPANRFNEATGKGFNDTDRYLFYESYAGLDLDCNAWKYQPYRGVSDPTDPDYRRQLVGPTGYADRNWIPAETTVVLWCDNHRDTIKRGGQPQYVLLLYDGRALLQPEADFLALGADAWRVTPP